MNSEVVPNERPPKQDQIDAPADVIAGVERTSPAMTVAREGSAL
jgi:hypothetical protein